MSQASVRLRPLWAGLLVGGLACASAISGNTPARADTATARSCAEVVLPVADNDTTYGLHTWVNQREIDGAPVASPVLLEMDNYVLPDNGCPQEFPTNLAAAHALSPEIQDRFTFVHVNLRGTGSSEGLMDLIGPGSQADVAQIVEWARTQPWSNGDIVVLGWSGTGVAAHHAVGLPGVRAAVLYTSCMEIYRCARPGGVYNGLVEVFKTFVTLSHASGVEARFRMGLAANPTPAEQLAATEAEIMRVRTHDVLDSFYEQRSSLARVASTTIPVLYTVDPYDVLSSPYDAFQATAGARLVTGIGHTSTGRGEGSRHVELVRGVVDRFVREHGLGQKQPGRPDAPVQLTTTLGSFDSWSAGQALVRPESTWPLRGTSWTRLYLDGTPSGSATSLNDGSLSSRAGSDRADEAVVLGGPDRSVDLRIVSSRAGNAATDLRDDEHTALTYTTPVLERDVEISGPVTLNLRAISSLPDLDWSVRLTDVAPDGRSEWITDGRLRASFRALDEQRTTRNSRGDVVRPYHDFTAAVPVTPGEATDYLIELWPMSNVFRNGHRIRLDILPFASSGPDVTGPGTFGTVSVLHDGSSLLLPLIPARCQTSTPLVSGVEPVDCARTWTEAMPAG